MWFSIQIQYSFNKTWSVVSTEKSQYPAAPNKTTEPSLLIELRNKPNTHKYVTFTLHCKNSLMLRLKVTQASHEQAPTASRALVGCSTIKLHSHRFCRGSHARSLTVTKVFSTTVSLWQSFTIITGDVKKNPSEPARGYGQASSTTPHYLEIDNNGGFHKVCLEPP